MLVTSQVGTLLDSKYDPFTGSFDGPIPGSEVRETIKGSKFGELFKPCMKDFFELASKFPLIFEMKSKVKTKKLEENAKKIKPVLESNFWDTAFQGQNEPELFDDLNDKLTVCLEGMKGDFAVLADLILKALQQDPGKKIDIGAPAEANTDTAKDASSTSGTAEPSNEPEKQKSPPKVDQGKFKCLIKCYYEY